MAPVCPLMASIMATVAILMALVSAIIVVVVVSVLVIGIPVIRVPVNHSLTCCHGIGKSLDSIS